MIERFSRREKLDNHQKHKLGAPLKSSCMNNHRKQKLVCHHKRMLGALSSTKCSDFSSRFDEKSEPVLKD